MSRLLNQTCAGRTAVVVPAYKPDDRLPPYVRALKEAGIGKIVIVDDGSGEAFQGIFSQIPEDGISHVISYQPNRGKGVALKQGMTYVLEECPGQDIIVTADSDGQHTVQDVLRMAGDLARDPSGLLLGSRDFSQEHVPPKSRMGNRITSVVFKLLYGCWVGDTQTGLRGFHRDLLPAMIAVRGDRYEYEMNVLIECAALRVPMRPLAIETVYENNNEGSHFRAFRDSARIYGVIFGGFFRFVGTSLFSFLVDYGLYLLFNNLLKYFGTSLDRKIGILFIQVIPHILIATVAARILSGVTNFFLNRSFVFTDRGKLSRAFLRYLGVFFLVMILSAVLTSSLHVWLGWSDNTAKIPVDIVLFFVSYHLQRLWVFQKKPGKPI